MKYQKTCLASCPPGILLNEERECIECSSICVSTCSGPSKADCDAIKIIYQLIVYIMAVITVIWLGSSITGYILDKRNSSSGQHFSNEKSSPEKIKTDSDEFDKNPKLRIVKRNLEDSQHSFKRKSISEFKSIEMVNNTQGSSKENVPQRTRLFKNPMIKYWTKAFHGRELPEINNHEMKSSREKNKPLTEESAKYTYNNEDEEQRANEE